MGPEMRVDEGLVSTILAWLRAWLRTPKAWVGIVGTLILMVMLGGIFSYQAGAFPAKNPYNVNPPSPWPGIPADALVEIQDLSSYATEGQAIEEQVPLQGTRLYAIVVELSFLDEPNAGRRFTNTADTLEIVVGLPDGTSKSASATGTNVAGGEALLTWDWTSGGGIPWGSTVGGGSTEISVKVTCTEAGDQEPRIDITHLRDRADGGNDYALLVGYIFAP